MTTMKFSLFFLLLFCVQEVCSQPINDLCSDATTISLGTSSFENIGATTDGNPHSDDICPSFSFGDDQIHQDIWFSYTADFDGFVSWSVCDSASFDTRMAVYQATDCPPQDADLVSCNDDGAACTQFTSFVFFPVINGETFLLRLGGYGQGFVGSGSHTLAQFTPPSAPDNSNCENFQEVAVVTQDQADLGEGWVMGNNENAPSNASNPECQTLGEFYDVWYRFNVGGNSSVTVMLETLSIGAQFFVELYEDCNTPALDGNLGGPFSETCFDAGTVSYEVLPISGFSQDSSNWYLRVSTYITAHDPGSFRVQIIGDEATSVLSDIESAIDIKVYSEQILLNLRGLASFLDYSIFDITGKDVTSQSLCARTESIVSIDTNLLSSGLYVLRLRDFRTDSRYSQRFFKP